MEARIKSRESVNNTPSLIFSNYGGLFWKGHRMNPQDHGVFSLKKVYEVRPTVHFYWEIDVFDERGSRIQSVCKDIIEEYTSP